MYLTFSLLHRNYFMNNYRKYTREELSELVNVKSPTTVRIILDRTAVEFLLALRVDRAVFTAGVDAIRQNIELNGWQETEPIIVADNSQLVDGMHRLLALQALGCPEVEATLLVGHNEASLTVAAP